MGSMVMVRMTHVGAMLFPSLGYYKECSLICRVLSMQLIFTMSLVSNSCLTPSCLLPNLAKWEGYS